MKDNRRPDLNRKIVAEPVMGLLVAGGLAASFAAASCCALPLLLGALGVTGAWLAGLALLAAPYRPALLAAAVICLAGGGGLLLRHRRAGPACAPGTVCGGWMLISVVTAALCLGVVLTVLGFVFA
jgi:mercuric ion transport protein